MCCGGNPWHMFCAFLIKIFIEKISTFVNIVQTLCVLNDIFFQAPFAYLEKKVGEEIYKPYQFKMQRTEKNMIQIHHHWIFQFVYYRTVEFVAKE